MASQKNVRERTTPHTNKCMFCGRQYQSFGGDDGFCSRVCATQYHTPKELRDFKNQISG